MIEIIMEYKKVLRRITYKYKKTRKYTLVWNSDTYRKIIELRKGSDMNGRIQTKTQ